MPVLVQDVDTANETGNLVPPNIVTILDGVLDWAKR